MGGFEEWCLQTSSRYWAVFRYRSWREGGSPEEPEDLHPTRSGGALYSLKQGREKTELQRTLHVICQAQTHPGFQFHIKLELGSQMSSQTWPCSDPDHAMREGRVTLRSCCFVAVISRSPTLLNRGNTGLLKVLKNLFVVCPCRTIFQQTLYNFFLKDIKEWDFFYMLCLKKTF